MDIRKRREIFQAYKDLPPGELAALARKTHLDPLPFVVKREEVAFLGNAANQWGRLLSAAFLDLWGPQTLVNQGVLPPERVWSEARQDPAYFYTVPSGVEPLTLVRLDLLRDNAGWWRVASVGTGVPRGLGFSLETRIQHSRTFGAQVPHDNLVRLAPFFQSLKDLWYRASLTHKDEPAIMVWTSGPSDPLYAEPVALSRYFGYPLVESRDLTVRSGRVFLKTLGGLRPVDVLVRMVPDFALDPLAGNPGGWGGVAGLVQAVRDGTVVVTNAPGAGLLEHPALLGDYAALSRHLLGEELLLPTAVPGLAASTEDFFEDDRWTPAPYAVRLFAARLASGWELMPGGLVQRLETPDSHRRDTFEGTKKDLWFLANEAVPLVTLLPTGEKPAEISRGADLPSRVADDLFWLGRYTERAWVDLRFLEKWHEAHFQGGREGAADGQTLDNLLDALAILPAEVAVDDDAWKESRLAETVASIHHMANQVLDRLSAETHRILREFGAFVATESAVPADAPSLPERLRQLNLRLAAFSGLTMESMTRSPGWRFLDMGRRLERALLVIESLSVFFEQQENSEQLGLLLDIFDSTLTYRTRYRLQPQRGPVLDLLLLDETNPRSLAFQVESLSRHVDQLPRNDRRQYWTKEERSILDALTRLRLTDGASLDAATLPVFLAGLHDTLETFTEAIHQTYLAKIDAMEALQARGRSHEAEL